jgi:acyl-coenzyme A synthetase/AMP-(fatty) acid ligase
MAGIELRSPSFGDHQPIPARHARDHDNLSPALEWSGGRAVHRLLARPQATAAAFRGDFYDTGDRAYVDEDGYFWFVARDDDVITSAAYRRVELRGREQATAAD